MEELSPFDDKNTQPKTNSGLDSEDLCLPDKPSQSHPMQLPVSRDGHFEQIVHDLNEALGVILAKAQLLLNTTNNERQIADGLRIIEKEALHGGNIVKQFQTGGSQNDSVSDFTQVDLLGILKNALEFVQSRWKNRSFAISKEFKMIQNIQGLAPCRGIQSELHDLFIYVFSRTFEIIPDGASLCLRTEKDNNFNRIILSDIGENSDADLFTNAFELILTDLDKKTGGAEVDNYHRFAPIIKRHNGCADINVREDGKAALVLSFPIDKFESIIEEDTPTRSRQPFNVLIIDDDEMTLGVLRDVLLSKGNYNVFPANNAMEGLEIFFGENIDLVVTDLGMPGMDGWEVAKRIRDSNPDVPVGIITGWGSNVDARKIEESKVDFFITKPFQIPDILDSVSESLRKSKTRGR